LIDPVDEALKLQYRTKGGGTVGNAEVKAEWEKVKERKDLINRRSRFRQYYHAGVERSGDQDPVHQKIRGSREMVRK